MAFCSFDKEYALLNHTTIDNTFIFEYMPDMDGDMVKVYLYGLYICQIAIENFSIDDFSKSLNLEITKIIEYFTYFEDLGLVNIIAKEPLSIKYLPIASFTPKPKKIKVEKYSDFNRSLQSIMPNRMISTNEYYEYFNLMENHNLKPEALIMIIKYCVDIKGKEIGYKYITTVAKDFITRKLITADAVEKELNDYFIKINDVQNILKALSSRRKPEIEDSNLYKKWTLNFGFDIETLLFIAKKFKKSSMKKFDELIVELYANKKYTPSEIEEYMAKKQELYDIAFQINRNLSVYYETLDAVIETYTGPWIAKGFDDKTLFFIAKYLFKHNKRSLEEMNATINKLYALGLISLESIASYIEENKVKEDFIKKILEALGINRKPNKWDKDNILLWQGSWNFSEELILYSASLSIGKTSPIPYMNSILGSWKNNGIFTLEQAKASSPQKITQNDQINKNDKSIHFEYERKYSKEYLDSLIDNIDDIEI